MILTFILANNFEADSKEYENMYQTMMLEPLAQVLGNVKTLGEEGREILPKYIVHGVHDLNLAQLLKFVGYYQLYKDKAKPIVFASSIRFELLQSKSKSSDFKIRVIFDDEVL